MASAGAAADCVAAACAEGGQVLALSFGDLNPLKWLGAGAAAVVTDMWKGAMVALWSSGLWVLEMTFKIIDAFTTPDLSSNGPLKEVLPYTFAIGAAVASLMVLIQLGAALYQRDGKSVGRVVVGLFQFGAVWIGYVTIAAVLVTATAGLTKGLLQSLLHVDAFSGFSNSAAWPREVNDTVVATVLGLSAIFLIFPAAIAYLMLMLVRAAALMLLTVTSPIAAAGLLADTSRAWFWKSLRWSIAALMVSPLAALVLGIGVKITQGTVEGSGDKTAAAVGMAVTGSVLILIGAVSPLVLFRLLAFVDPGTSSGTAMRSSLAAAGGVAGLLSGKAGAAGSAASAGTGAATKADGQGRSQGESSADAATQSRFAGFKSAAARLPSAGTAAVGGVAASAMNIGADILGGAGIGHQAPYFGQNASAAGATPGGSSSGGSPAATGDGTPPDADPADAPQTPPTGLPPILASPPSRKPPPPAAGAVMHAQLSEPPQPGQQNAEAPPRKPPPVPPPAGAILAAAPPPRRRQQLAQPHE